MGSAGSVPASLSTVYANPSTAFVAAVLPKGDVGIQVIDPHGRNAVSDPSEVIVVQTWTLVGERELRVARASEGWRGQVEDELDRRAGRAAHPVCCDSPQGMPPLRETDEIQCCEVRAVGDSRHHGSIDFIPDFRDTALVGCVHRGQESPRNGLPGARRGNVMVGSGFTYVTSSVTGPSLPAASIAATPMTFMPVCRLSIETDWYRASRTSSAVLSSDTVQVDDETRVATQVVVCPACKEPVVPHDVCAMVAVTGWAPPANWRVPDRSGAVTSRPNAKSAGTPIPPVLASTVRACTYHTPLNGSAMPGQAVGGGLFAEPAAHVQRRSSERRRRRRCRSSRLERRPSLSPGVGMTGTVPALSIQGVGKPADPSR